MKSCKIFANTNLRWEIQSRSLLREVFYLSVEQ